MRTVLNVLAVYCTTMGALDVVNAKWWFAACFLLAAIAARRMAVRY
jgi:hypothetical protein